MNATNIPHTVVEVRLAKHLKGELAPDNFDVVFPHTIVEGGLRAAPQALVSLLTGAYRGNVSVKAVTG